MSTLTFHDTPPAVEEYLALRRAADLGARDADGARRALPNSLVAVTVRNHGELVAMGRVVGDGGCHVQIVDVAVHPQWQRKGLGREIAKRLIAWCEAELPPSCHMSLVASPDAVPLYETFGFELCRGLDRYADVALRLSK